MPYAPATIVKLCYVPLDSTQKNQIKFASAAAQASYFSGTARHSYTDFSFQRKDNAIRIPAHIDTLWDCNYCMYDNAAVANKWFYAFIERLEYVNDGVTLVYIKTDVFQTWMLDCTIQPSFVVREMAATTEAPGDHTVPEGLEVGDYIEDANASVLWGDLDDLAIVVAVTEYWDGSAWQTAPGTFYNGVYSGVKLYYSTSASAISSMIDFYLTPDAGSTYWAPRTKIDSIVGIWMVPRAMIGTSATLAEAPQSSSCATVTRTAHARPGVIDGYTPKNKKLLTHPYVYLSVDNNAGALVDYKFEQFSGTPAFQIYGGIMPNPSYKLTPTNMINGSTVSHMEQGITISGFPMCAWSTDSFAAWLGQNAGSFGIAAMMSATALVGGAATGNPLAIAGGVAGVLSQINQLQQKMAAPDQMQGSLNSPSANIAKRVNDFFFKVRTIKAEYARIIDDFFDMYGYKTNRVKLPELTNRPYWNYVQTIDMNIKGDVPVNDLTELKAIFNQGVTLWHSGANVGDYTLNNH